MSASDPGSGARDDDRDASVDDVVLSSDEQRRLIEESGQEFRDDDEQADEGTQYSATISGDYANIIQAEKVIYITSPRQASVDYDELARLPTPEWYAKCNKRGVKNVTLLAAVAFIPNGPQDLILKASAKLGQKLGLTAVTDTIEERIAEIGGALGETQSVFSQRKFASIVFNQAAPARAAEARRHLWAKVGMKEVLADWLNQLAEINDPDVSTRMGGAVGEMVGDLSSLDSDDEHKRAAYSDLIYTWARRGGHARNALSSALSAIYATEAARPFLRSRLTNWASYRNNSEHLTAALNVCLSPWAAIYPQLAMNLLNDLSRVGGRELAPKVQRSINKLWRAASRPGAISVRRAEIISSALAEQLSPNAASLFHVLPSIQFSRAVRAELAGSTGRPVIYALMDNDAGEGVTTLITAGLARRGARSHVTEMLEALRKHAKGNAYER